MAEGKRSQKKRMAREKVKRVVQKAVKRKEVPARDIGVDVKPPRGSCDDPRCPFHGRLPVRGQIVEGTVKSHAMKKTVVVVRERRFFVKKYERYERRSSSFLAHNPPCIDAKVGDRVRIMECRPISKAKSFVVIERRETT